MDAVQICSVSPEPITLPRRTYNMSGYHIPACPKDKPFTSVVVTDMMDEKKIYTEYDWTKAERIPIPIPVKEIVADYFANEKLEAMGCFTIAADAIPSEQQIAEARGRRVAWLQLLVQEGDKEFLRTRKIDQIPDFCKRAVKELNINREWAFQAPGQMIDCPVCGEALKSGVALCKSCGAILDRDKAAAYGLVAEMAETKKPGRKPKQQEEELGGI